MTVADMTQLFDAHAEDVKGPFLKFADIVSPKHRRPDICAFLMLSELVPDDSADIVTSSEYDQVWLNVNIEKLAAAITVDQIIDLSRCGIWFDKDTESLSMFV